MLPHLPFPLLLVCSTFFYHTHAWLPSVDKIRGVSLGGLFISEPWYMIREWSSMNCTPTTSEFDCVKKLGQEQADLTFQKHYDRWITRREIWEIKQLGLNTIRIPVGYWLKEDLVYQDTEFFPKGGFPYLQRICEWAKEEGLYVVINFRGAPGSQRAGEPWTGRVVAREEFFVEENYQRAYKFLEWLTREINTNQTAFGSVGLIEVLNEPALGVPKWDRDLLVKYYPTVWKRIRAVEKQMDVKPERKLHLSMLSDRYYKHNMVPPTVGLSKLDLAIYGDHHFPRNFGAAIQNHTRAEYIHYYCYNNRSSNLPVIVGEWSIAVNYSNKQKFDIRQKNQASLQRAKEWYRHWWIVQSGAYEKDLGWVFWTWKMEEFKVGRSIDWRWSYRHAVKERVIPANASLGGRDAAARVCNGTDDGGLWPGNITFLDDEKSMANNPYMSALWCFCSFRGVALHAISLAMSLTLFIWAFL